MDKTPSSTPTPSDDSTFFQEMQDEQSVLGKQALEVFRTTEKYEKELQMDEQGAHKSRQLLESLTTGKSFTQLYDEAVNELEKQRLLTTQIFQTITNEQLTFEQKKETIDQLEHSCGNKMYVIAFNTLIEKHAISPCFMPEHYQELITIDTDIQARRDLEISDFMQMIHDLMQTSTTVTDPIERQDIVLKMGIIMILGSGINVRKIHEAELMRLKQEFASLFFEIPPGKNGSGTKKILKTIMKSYTSIELNADLHRIYPPLSNFVEMVDGLLESSKDKETKKSIGRKRFTELHDFVNTAHTHKIANAIDNIGDRENDYDDSYDPKKNEALLRDRNKIANNPQRAEQYFSFLYLTSRIPLRNNLSKDDDSQHLPNTTIGGMVEYLVDQTERNRRMNSLFELDLNTVDDEVIAFVLQYGICSCWLLRKHLSFERMLSLLPREFILKQIQSDSFPLEEFVKIYGLDTLKAHPDGMWILMQCMTEKLKGESYDTVQIDSYGNVYRQLREEINERERINIPSPDRERVGTSIDGRSVHFDNESVIATGEYVTTREKAYTGYQKLNIYKDFIRVFVKEGHKDDGEIVGEVANDCFVTRKGDRHEICRRGKHHPGTIYYKDSDVILSGVSDGWIREHNRTNKTVTFIDIDLDEQLSFSADDYKKIGDFHEGLAWCTKNETAWSGTYGFIDKTGKEVIPCIYDRVDDFSEGLCQVRKDGVHFFIDQKNEIVLSPDVYFSKIDKNALPEKQEFHFQQAHPFKNGFTRVMYKYKNYPRGWSTNPSGYEQAANKILTRFLDKTGKILKFPGSMVITSASDFCGGIAKVQLQDGSRGLIDTFGNFYPVGK